jgi:hypothetical protein
MSSKARIYLVVSSVPHAVVMPGLRRNKTVTVTATAASLFARGEQLQPDVAGELQPLHNLFGGRGRPAHTDSSRLMPHRLQAHRCAGHWLSVYVTVCAAKVEPRALATDIVMLE